MIRQASFNDIELIEENINFSNAILSDLKLLFNFEMDSRDRAVMLLAGLPQLNNTLCNSALLIAHNKGYNKVTSEDAMTAVNDFQLS